MTTVLAPLVDEVELVDAEEVDPETEPRTDPRTPRTAPWLAPEVAAVEPLVLVEVLDVLDVLEVEPATLPRTPRTAPWLAPVLPVDVLDELLVDVLEELAVDVELVDVPEVEPDVDEVEPPSVSWVATLAFATPCQTMPTSIIPAATAAMRLTVVRRPGLISTLFPSN